jgi:hypothetical protein
MVTSCSDDVFRLLKRGHSLNFDWIIKTSFERTFLVFFCANHKVPIPSCHAIFQQTERQQATHIIHRRQQTAEDRESECIFIT